MSSSVTICSLHEGPFSFQRTYGYPVINGRSNGDEYALTVIEDKIDRKSHGENEWSDVTIPAAIIAQDLVVTQDLEKLGIFICAGTTPTSKELAQAMQKRMTFAREMVQAGDAEYMKGNRNPRLVPEICRWAASLLGEEREWHYATPTKLIECPGCGKKVREGIAVHPECGAILDREKAISLDILQPEPAIAGAPERKGREK